MLHLNQIQILMYTLPGNSPALPAHGSGWEEPLHSRNSAAHMRAVRTGPPRPPLFLGASHHGLLGRGGEAAPQGLELANAEVLTQAASWGGGRLHACETLWQQTGWGFVKGQGQRATATVLRSPADQS